MQTGVINQENFSQILRGISQRRKQGILEVRTGEDVVKIFFNIGRVVEVEVNQESPAQSLARSLTRAGILDSTTDLAGVESYEDIEKRLSEQGVEDAGQFVSFAVRHRVLDALFELEFAGGSFYRFHIEMVEFDRDRAPSLSVGQLLLDLVAYHEDRPAFDARFASDRTIALRKEPDGSLTDEEARLVSCVQKPISSAELRSVSLVSRFHFQEAVTALFNRGILKCVEAQEPEPMPISALGADDLFAALDASIENAFDEVCGSSDAIAALEQSIGAPTASTARTPVTGVDHSPVGGTPAAAMPRLNAWILSRSWVPQAAVSAILLAALAAPLVLWSDIIWAFSGR